MPIEAQLYLDTTASPEEVKAHLLRTMPFEDKPDFKDFKCLASKATYVQIGRTPDPSWLEFYPAPFNIDDRISILIGCRDDSDGLGAYDTETVEATLSLLKRFAGDAVLIMYEDVPVLLRKGGALKLLYTEGDIWDARAPGNRLSLVDLPYTVEPLSNYRW